GDESSRLRRPRWGRYAMNRCPATYIGLFLATALAGLLQPGAARGQAVDPIYKGKQIRLVVGSGAGGGYDIFARTLSRYLERHIPGQPTIVNQNMEGAAGLTATNWGFRLAPKDGTVILALANAVLLERLFGNRAADYDTLGFEWI